VWRIETWKQKARELRTETYALYLAVKDPRVPWYAKFSAVCVVAYALSPIDLIPDFIPVLGYVDDLILIPLGIALTIKMIPPEVLAECKANAQLKVPQGKFLGWVGAILVLALWVVIIFAVVLWFSRPEKQVLTQNESLHSSPSLWLASGFIGRQSESTYPETALFKALPRLCISSPCRESLHILLRLRQSKAMSREATSSFSFYLQGGDQRSHYDGFLLSANTKFVNPAFAQLEP
jgi:uncharacterized membrane protein YkvA (DUF1232 family)